MNPFAILGAVFAGIQTVMSVAQTATNIAENERRNAALRRLGEQQADAHLDAGEIEARRHREQARFLMGRAGLTREQAHEYRLRGLHVRGQQSIQFAQGGVRSTSGSARSRLTETTGRIGRGVGRINRVADEFVTGAGQQRQAAEDAMRIAGYRAESAKLAAEAGQQSSFSIGLAGAARTVGAASQFVDQLSQLSAAGGSGDGGSGGAAGGAGGAGSAAPLGYQSSTQHRQLFQWG